jgi:hypothetical protein
LPNRPGTPATVVLERALPNRPGTPATVVLERALPNLRVKQT